MDKLIEQKCDKRSVKTRSKIKQAFMVLLKNKSMSEISIKEITKLAGVNRNSFYTHYDNLNDVINDMQATVFEKFDDIANKYNYNEFISDPYPLMHELTSALISNQAFSEYVLFSKNSAEFVRSLVNNLTDKIYMIYIKERGDTNPCMPYMISFLVSGTIEYYFRWFGGDKTLSIDDITKQVSLLVKDGISMVRNVKQETKR